MRSCLNSTGPGEIILMARAIRPITGTQTGEATTMQNRSKLRFQPGIEKESWHGSDMRTTASFIGDSVTVESFFMKHGPRTAGCRLWSRAETRPQKPDSSLLT